MRSRFSLIQRSGVSPSNMPDDEIHCHDKSNRYPYGLQNSSLPGTNNLMQPGLSWDPLTASFVDALMREVRSNLQTQSTMLFPAFRPLFARNKNDLER